MTQLDAASIRQSLTTASNLDRLEVFSRIDSTNTYLKDQPSPQPGRFRVAIAEHQTAGRGRQDRAWISSPGKSLCLSLSYRFAVAPPDLQALTLALGVGVAASLSDLGVARVKVKWPNDILIGDEKLGGMLTEAQYRASDDVTVIVGLGLNIGLPEALDADDVSDWADTATDLKSVLEEPPSRQELSRAVIDTLFETCKSFEHDGFQAFADQFRRFDALSSRNVVLDTPDGVVNGIAQGVDEHGALLVEVDEALRPVITGSVKHIGNRDGST
ncbi:MAG: biotin--[acetyl-CoA-carboxylase] ligase [Woeseiaceae bacterium]